MGDEEKRPVGRPKSVPMPTYPLEEDEEVPMEQSDENILLNNLRAMDEFGAMLQLSCKLLRHKDHLARQVDRLERQVADLRTKVELEQRRFDTLAGARRELVTG